MTGTATYGGLLTVRGTFVGEHSIIDGDCDDYTSLAISSCFVGEHSIIDGDCDMMGEALRSLENERKTFVQSVQNMYNLGLDTTQIAQITNRSIAEIEALLDEAG